MYGINRFKFAINKEVLEWLKKICPNFSNDNKWSIQ